MKMMLILLFVVFFSLIGVIGCGDNRRVVENDYIAFTLDNNFDYAFLDVDPDQQTIDFPLGDQMRALIWDKDFPHYWQIFIYYPCPTNVSDLLGNTTEKTIDGVDVLMAENEGYYFQVYLDPIMTVGISAIKDEANIQESNLIVESLSVKKNIDEQ